MRNLWILMLGVLYGSVCHAQYSSYTIGATAEQIIDRLQGDSVLVLNPEVRCEYGSETYGLYEGMGELGIDTGLVISVSPMNKIFSPYEDYVLERAVSALAPLGPYDTLLTQAYIDPLMRSWGLMEGGTNHNYNCAISVDVVSLRNTIEFSYVLGDTHFDPEDYFDLRKFWVTFSNMKCFLNTNVIGIFLSGGAYTDTVNYAVFAQGHDDVTKRKPVNRYTLRMTQDMFDYYCTSADEDTMLFDGIPMLDYLRYNTGGALVPDINFSGFSTRMDVSIPVQVCDTHKLTFIVHRTLLQFIDEGGHLDYGAYGQYSGTGLFISPLRGSGPDSCTASTGIEGGVEALHIGLYPNPFIDRLSISTPYAQREYTVRVADLLGRTYGEVLQGTAVELEEQLSHLIPSLSIQQWYLFTITDPSTGQNMTFKLRKE